MNDLAPLLPPVRRERARPGGRFPWGFAPRTFLLLLVGFIWLGPAWWDLRLLGVLAVWDIGVLALWRWDMARLPRPEQLTGSRRWLGVPALTTLTEVEIGIESDSTVPLLLTLQDTPPSSFQADAAGLEAEMRRGRPAAARYAIRPRERGDQPVGELFLRYQSHLRFAERWAIFALPQTVKIYPDIETARRHALFLIRTRQTELEKRLKRVRGLGREFESLRDYRDGDDFRDICWTATARRGKPITKTYQIERSQTVWLVIDTGRLLRARAGELTKLDFTVNASLSLAQVALHFGDRVGLMAYGRRPRALLQPGKGANHLRAMLEALADVSAEPHEADHLLAAETLLTHQKRRGLVLWLTDLAETAAVPDILESAFLLMPRHLVLFVVMSHPEMLRVAGTAPDSPWEMYRLAAVQEMLTHRELLLQQLRHRGAFTAELDPDALALGVVNSYLSIKERSLL